MDAQPLLIVKPEDLVDVAVWLLIGCACAACAAWFFMQVVAAVAHAVRRVVVERPWKDRIAKKCAHHERSAALFLRLHNVHMQALWRLEVRQQRERDRRAELAWPELDQAR